MNTKTCQLILTAFLFILISCSPTGMPKPGFVKENIQFAAAQEKLQVDAIEQSGKVLNPRTVDNGKVKYMANEAVFFDLFLLFCTQLEV